MIYCQYSLAKAQGRKVKPKIFFASLRLCEIYVEELFKFVAIIAIQAVMCRNPQITIPILMG